MARRSRYSRDDAYTALTSRERFRLAMKACQRGDEDDYARLFVHCPYRSYSRLDHEFVQLMETAWRAAWSFVTAWSDHIAARQNGINEVFDAACRALTAEQLERLVNSMRYARQSVSDCAMVMQDNVSASADPDPGKGDCNEDAAPFIPEAYLISTGPPESSRPSGYLEFTRHQQSIAEGFRRYAEAIDLTVIEALGPLREPLRFALMAQMAALPDVPYYEQVAQNYHACFARGCSSNELAPNETDKVDREKIVRNAPTKLPEIGDSDLRDFEECIEWHRDNIDVFIRKLQSTSQ